MPLNHEAVGITTDPVRVDWTTKDTILYALGAGCGVDALQFTTENSKGITLQTLPSMPVVLARTPILTMIGDIDWTKLVHAAQHVSLHQPLPPKGSANNVATVTGIYDKGKAAIVVTETVGRDAGSGEKLWTSTMHLYIRGAGGWGGEKGPSLRSEPPQRQPDASVTVATAENQALIYRLSGDRNPLHSDPSFARAAGFDRPILHGLCTFGVSTRAIVETMAEGDAANVVSIAGSFAAPVFPGDPLTVDMWRTDEDSLTFRTRVKDTEVITGGTCQFASGELRPRTSRKEPG
ncbi:MaoC/PaaZ C-terminal domain-containing protein [Mycobacterium florentinum]|uniref:MaoC/PaaZ C-terminal domain-containing protein n=1 Tax=Mycobacterium florentinum TaxID=292462 RepID=UPI000A1698F1|nr:MaoC/PaaZ C-terminal domain-containing protein [Mycobacterium florentinum]MCV7411393.1 MaoC family dehydratase N-terminal domain-containing protein [Mycobacterium florentinum]BBX80753.1 3-hydroxyacyl-thioester dehydratase HtdY [Mycobacterium florentinum]